MFNDINISKDAMKEFKETQYARTIANSGVDFTAEILTNGHWPENPPAACTLPPELKDISSKFE
jgi:hypothetical protein